MYKGLLAGMLAVFCSVAVRAARAEAAEFDLKKHGGRSLSA
jgi:hypothetical protein